MIAMLGFATGYVLGAKAGPRAVAQLSEAWKVIRASDEFKMALSGASAVAAGMMQRTTSGSRGEYGKAVSMVVDGVADMLQKRNLRVVS